MTTMMPDWMRHDHMHCANAECPKKDKCFRYLLHLEDASKRLCWCTYGSCRPDENGNCREFIDRKEYDAEEA